MRRIMMSMLPLLSYVCYCILNEISYQIIYDHRCVAVIFKFGTDGPFRNVNVNI